MAERISTPEARAAHWDEVHRGGDEKRHSWYQSEHVLTLQLLDELHVGANAAFLDVGGGESSLVDRLLARGFNDVTVLDVASEALAVAQRRIGSDPRVTWLVDDVLTWKSARRYDVWHDRAVFHFLAGDEVDVYRTLLDHTLAPGGAIILATFAPDGPESCSGLAVQRYGLDELAAFLGADFEVVASRGEVHTTPWGLEQSFTWIAARRRDS